MARIRSVKPELRTSLTVAEWPRDVRYAWVLLWGYLDDHGRGVDNVKLVTADLFPLDDDVDAVVMDSWLGMIADSGSLCRYEVDGKRYMHATNWTGHQKPSHPTPSRIPPCPLHQHDQSSRELLPKYSGEAPDDFVPEQGGGAGSREQGAGRAPSATALHPSSTAPVDADAPPGALSSPRDARCRKHRGNPDPPACRGCERARLAAEADFAQHAQAAATAAAAARAAAQSAPWCGACDPNGRWLTTPTGDKRCPDCNEVELLKRANRPPLAVVGAR